ncbi:MAG TPA: anthranilate phosphoribosyltransferase, partial [Armatimonadota bacterium]|nr:anthranilate phosphoribosyltransferase [Armatimonadota bacterium]
ILEGETGPKRDIVVVNAAAAIYVGGKADSVSDGFDLAEKSIDDGAARRTLRKMISFSNGE